MAQYPSAVSDLNIPKVQPLGPLDAAKKALGIQEQRQNLALGKQRLDINKLTIQEQQQEQADAEAVRQVAQKYQGDLEKMQQELNVINPSAAAKLAKTVADRHKVQAETDKADLDIAERKNDMIGRMASSVKDETSYRAVLAQAESLLGPEKARQIFGNAYNPDSMKQVMESHMKTSELLQMAQESNAKARLALDEKKSKAEQDKAWEEAAAHRIEGTSSQEDLDAALQALASRGVPANILSAYGQQWTAETPNKARKILGRETAINLQSKNGILNGKPFIANFNPRTGEYLDPATGRPITGFQPKPDADSEPGSYVPVTDSRGVVTGWVNPKTRKVVTAAELGVAGGFRGPMSPERQKMEENAQSGLRAIDKLRSELKKPGMLAELAIPTSPAARTARAARGEMIDVITRLRTGAALNKDEQAFYRDQAPGLIDALFGDPDTIEYKLSIFENEFKGLAGGSGGDIQKPNAPNAETPTEPKRTRIKF